MFQANLFSAKWVAVAWAKKERRFSRFDAFLWTRRSSATRLFPVYHSPCQTSFRRLRSPATMHSFWQDSFQAAMFFQYTCLFSSPNPDLLSGEMIPRSSEFAPSLPAWVLYSAVELSTLQYDTPWMILCVFNLQHMENLSYCSPTVRCNKRNFQISRCPLWPNLTNAEISESPSNCTCALRWSIIRYVSGRGTSFSKKLESPERCHFSTSHLGRIQELPHGLWVSLFLIFSVSCDFLIGACHRRDYVPRLRPLCLPSGRIQQKHYDMGSSMLVWPRYNMRLSEICKRLTIWQPIFIMVWRPTKDLVKHRLLYAQHS